LIGAAAAVLAVSCAYVLAMFAFFGILLPLAAQRAREAT
jgi:hypothetical protein